MGEIWRNRVVCYKQGKSGNKEDKKRCHSINTGIKTGFSIDSLQQILDLLAPYRVIPEKQCACCPSFTCSPQSSVWKYASLPFSLLHCAHSFFSAYDPHLLLSPVHSSHLSSKCWMAKWKYLQFQNFWHGTPEEVWCLGFQHACEKNGHIPRTRICIQLQNQSHSLVYALNRTESNLPVRMLLPHAQKHIGRNIPHSKR